MHVVDVCAGKKAGRAPLRNDTDEASCALESLYSLGCLNARMTHTMPAQSTRLPGDDHMSGKPGRVDRDRRTSAEVKQRVKHICS